MMTSNGDCIVHEARTMQRMKIQFVRALMMATLAHHAAIQLAPRPHLDGRGLGGMSVRPLRNIIMA